VIDGLREAIRKSEARLERTREASRRFADAVAKLGRPKSPAEIVAQVDIQDRLEDAERTLDRHRFAMTAAESKRDVLEKYTRDKTVKELESEIRKARSDELAKQATWELEKTKEQALERQIAACSLTAPVNGTMYYANDPSRVFGRVQPQIEEGATVRERQMIARIFDREGPMQINAKIHESEIAEVIPRMSVRVTVDAFPGKVMPGVVTDVAPLPDPMNSFAGDIKVYTTHIRIGQRPDGLVPGLSAEVHIEAGELNNVISVPRGVVIHYGGKDHVAVKADDGRVEWREVLLGASDGASVAVDGLRDGEKVILDPHPFLDEAQQMTLKAEREAAAVKDVRRRADREAAVRKADELLKARGYITPKR
jgi:hypothetical protein